MQVNPEAAARFVAACPLGRCRIGWYPPLPVFFVVGAIGCRHTAPTRRRPRCCPLWFRSRAECAGGTGHRQASHTSTNGSRCSAPHPEFLPKRFSFSLGLGHARSSSVIGPLSVCSCAVYQSEMKPDVGARRGAPPPGSARERAPNGGRAPSRPRIQRRPATSTANLCGYRHQAVRSWQRRPTEAGPTGAPGRPIFSQTGQPRRVGRGGGGGRLNSRS